MQVQALLCKSEFELDSILVYPSLKLANLNKMVKAQQGTLFKFPNCIHMLGKEEDSAAATAYPYSCSKTLKLQLNDKQTSTLANKTAHISETTSAAFNLETASCTTSQVDTNVN